MNDRQSPKRDLIDALSRMKGLLERENSAVALAQVRGLTDHCLNLVELVGERQNVKKKAGDVQEAALSAGLDVLLNDDKEKGDPK